MTLEERAKDERYGRPLTGEVGAVRGAVAAGVETVKKEGMLIHSIVIPYSHKDLASTLV